MSCSYEALLEEATTLVSSSVSCVLQEFTDSTTPLVGDDSRYAQIAYNLMTDCSVVTGVCQQCNCRCQRTLLLGSRQPGVLTPPPAEQKQCNGDCHCKQQLPWSTGRRRMLSSARHIYCSSTTCPTPLLSVCH